MDYLTIATGSAKIDQILGLAVLLLAGYFGGRLARKVKLPAVAGYVLTGLVLSPSLINVIPGNLNTAFDFIKDIGLGYIAMVVGGELDLRKIRSLGKSITIITLVQSIGTFVIVAAIIWAILGRLTIALLLGALATATAPAATVAVIREYKARGVMTQTLLGVVALDDAFCIIIVGLVASVAAAITRAGAFDMALLIDPLIELAGSLVLGIVAGFILAKLLTLARGKDNFLVIAFGVILLNSGLAGIMQFSPLLVNMISGFMVANLLQKPEQVFEATEAVELPIFIIFFTLAGASLHVSALLESWRVGLLYILGRIAGKVGGTYGGAVLAHADEKVKKWMGLAMLPKAGVSIGLVFFLADRFPELAGAMMAIELAAVTVFEIFGPVASKIAIFGAGEVPQEQVTSSHP